MEAPEGCPSEVYEIMRQVLRCEVCDFERKLFFLQAWDLNPDNRPTFQEVKAKLLHFKQHVML